MEWTWLAALVALWVLALFLGFLVLGLFRQLGLLSWRLEKLEATTPSRIGRDGLRVGTSAPHFTLKDIRGAEVSLRDFANRKLLLAFTQPGCGPCDQVVPDLNALHSKGEFQVVGISNGEPVASMEWAEQHHASYPVLCQEGFKLSRRYEVFATPFAFLVDERGLIAGKGIINNGQHIRYLLASVRDGVANGEMGQS